MTEAKGTETEPRKPITWKEKNGRWGFETSDGSFAEMVTNEEHDPVVFRTGLKVLEEIFDQSPNLRIEAEAGLISFTMSGGTIHLHHSEAWHRKQDELTLQNLELYRDAVKLMNERPNQVPKSNAGIAVPHLAF